MIVTIYNSTTGLVERIIRSGNIENVNLNIQEGETWLEGEYPYDQYYVKNGTPIPFPTKPDYKCYFDINTEQWVQDTPALWEDLRAARDRQLQKCDWTQVPDAPVDQSTWAAYRQALRDLPANTTDPLNPPWPTKPS